MNRVGGTGIRKVVTVAVMAAVLLMQWPFIPVARAAEMTFVVNTTSDETGLCDATSCSLREAIEAANANPGPDIINFNISGGAPFTISPTSALPSIDSPATIDGTTQPGWSNKPLIFIDGTGAGSVTGLVLAGGDTTVRSLAIGNFVQNGIAISSSNNRLVGNYVGLTTTGNTAAPNSTGGLFAGIVVLSGIGNVIGNDTPPTTVADINVVSANHGQGIEVRAGAGVHITVNRIGTDSNGGGALGNGVNGIYIAADGTMVDGNVIMHNGTGIGLGANQVSIVRNIINSNTNQGIQGFGNSNLISANNIVGNTNGGVLLGYPGTSTNSNRLLNNTITDNGGDGILLRGPLGQPEGTFTFGNTIRGSLGSLGGSITNNAAKGIDLFNNANGSIPSPTVTSIQTGDGLRVAGTSQPSGVIDIYADPSNEGSMFLGQTQADANGAWSKSTWAPLDVGPVIASLVAGGLRISATETDDSGNTSEFSAPLVLRSVAYVYLNDDASRAAFVSFLSGRGFQVDAVTVSEAATHAFSAYAAIVIGNDTGSLSTWGTPQAVSNISAAGKPIVGVGEGGYAFFGRRFNGTSGTIGWPNGAHGIGALSVNVVDGANSIWTTPNTISPHTTDALVPLYSTGTPYVTLYNPTPISGITRIGRDPGSTSYYNVIAQGCYTLWGFGNSPATMTTAGQDLFHNALLTPACAAENADLALTKTDSADPIAVGSTFSYTLTVTNNGPQAASSVTLTDPLPAAVSFVSVSPSACAAALGTVTCNFGTLASSASASATVNVRADTATTLTNIATVSSTTPDRDLGNNTATQVTAVQGITGLAQCLYLNPTSTVVLPNASVKLFSGSVVVASTTAASNGMWAVSGLPQTVATYTVLYEGTIDPRTYTCGTSVTTDAGGNGTAASPTPVQAERGNTSWPTATLLTGTTDADRLAGNATERWYVFKVPFNSEVSVKLEGPTGYGLALFRDLGKISGQLAASTDGKSATAASNGTASTPLGATPLGATPLGATPLGATPLGATPLGATPLGATPLGATPLGATPLGATPLGATPLGATPLGATPLGATPLGATPLGATIYVMSQAIGLLGFQSAPGSPKLLVRNSYGLSEYFYARVYAVNGVFSAAESFTFTLNVGATNCAPAPDAQALTWSPSAPTTQPKTVILTNTARLRKADGAPLTGTEALAHLTRLSQYSQRAEVMPGLVVDLAGTLSPGFAAFNGATSKPANVRFIDGVGSLYDYWDVNKACGPAANPVAAQIREVILKLRALGGGTTLANVALIGPHFAVPNLLLPDHVELMNEVNFETGAIDPTKTRAQVTGGYVPTDDFYGSFHPVLRFDHELYVPEVSVGRLVETLEDVDRYLDNYFATTNGVVTIAQGSPALVTGYDFLTDLAGDIRGQLAAGLAVDATLVAPTMWTANDLRNKLGLPIPGSTAPPATPTSYRFISLNAHFSPWELLAGDNATTVNSLEIANLPPSDTRFRNTLVLSIGCHSGFTLSKADLQAGIQDIDWVQGLVRSGATLVAPTTYGYGDTDFVRYTEELLSDITKELRYGGTGPVSIGSAHSLAKQVYVSRLVTLTGADEKSLAALALYGLPTLSYDLPDAVRTPRPGAGPALTPVAVGAGGVLSAADLTPSFDLVKRSKTLTVFNPDGTTAGTVDAYYWANQVTVGSTATDDVTVVPFRPVLPRVVRNIASTTGAQPHGVAFLSGDYTDHPNLRPLVAVPATEIAGLHPAIDAPNFVPQPPYAINDLLLQPSSGGGVDLLSQALVITPAQFRSVGSAGTGTHRVTGLCDANGRCVSNDTTAPTKFRIYYVDPNAPLFQRIAAPPTIISTLVSSAGPNTVRVEITVAGASAVDMADLFATFTAEPSAPANGLQGHWDSCSAVNGTAYSSSGSSSFSCAAAAPVEITAQAGSQAFMRRYSVEITTPSTASDLVRLWVQAIGGSGAWAVDNNGGAYFRVPPAETTVLANPKIATTLGLTVSTASAPFGSTVDATATLSAASGPALNGEIVFTFGSAVARVPTTAGSATAHFTVNVDPSTTPYQLTASFAETPTYLGAFAAQSVNVTKASTAFAQVTDLNYPATTYVARLVSGSLNLNEQVVFVDVPATASTPARTFARLTDGYGRISLDPVKDQLPTSVRVTLRYLGTRRYLSATAATVFVVRQIAFTSTRDGNYEIYVMRADGGGVTRLTNNSRVDAAPTWSPDGKKIAFVSSRGYGDDRNFDIYVMNADGSGVVRLTTNVAGDAIPAWSPDGSRIAFVSNRDGNVEIYVMSATGGAATRLTTNGAIDISPAWSPDSSQIVFTSNRSGNNFEIYVMNANGTGVTRLTTNGAVDSSPAWSPDGSKIAFSSNRDGNFEIYVMYSNGTGATRLTTNGAADVSPAWSPDGSKIAFSSNRIASLNFEIYVMNADGSGATRLTTNPALDVLPAW